MKSLVNGFKTFIDFFKTLFDIIMSFFETIGMVFRYLLTIVELAFNFVATLPEWLKAFGVITISITIAYFILGRNAGKNGD